MNKKEVGQLGERVAEKYLKDKGYKLLSRNWLSKIGEIDLIFKRDKILVFVEVKALIKLTNSFNPEMHFNYFKQNKMRQLAKLYINFKGLSNISFQIDLVAVEINEYGKVLDIRHYPA
ncbi:MAG: YraN family protein [Patescibacteria group bacterium]